jgi:ABC-type Fe3+ transport system permease subunit
VSTLRDHILLFAFTVVALHVALGVASVIASPPEDVLHATDWWDDVARAALAGLGTGITSAVALVAAALGIEVRVARGRNRPEG